MSFASVIATILEMEPRSVRFDLQPNGAVFLSQKDELGVDQILVVEPQQLRLLADMVEKATAGNAPKKPSKRSRELAT